MNIFKILIGFIIGSFLLAASCHKENEHEIPAEPIEKFCWIFYDPNGQIMDTICDKTAEEAELLNAGVFYEPLEAEKFCWKIYDSDIRNTSEQYAAYYFLGAAVKVDCSEVVDCAFWYSREKRFYKPDSSITYSQVRSSKLCGDTLLVLYDGREQFLRETDDSLILRQFSDDGMF